MSYANVMKNWKVQLVIAIIILVALAVAVKGINFGIEFKGGVRIPISIISDQGLTPDQMAEVVDTLKTRVNKYGLSQSVIRPLGDKEIIVEIPNADQNAIKSIEDILRQQGHFEAIVDGKVALAGSDLLPNAVGGSNGERVVPTSGGYRWELDFVATREGAQKFANAALGKADYPVNMFLDRPSNAVLFMNRAQLTNNTGFGTSATLEKAMRAALKKEGDDVELVFIEDINDTAKEAQRISSAGKTRVVLPESFRMTHSTLVQALEAQGFKVDLAANLTAPTPQPGNETNSTRKTLVEKPDATFIPATYQQGLVGTIVQRWDAVGLLSAPTLSASLATGSTSQFYQVSGSAAGITPDQQKKAATEELRSLKSIISGGKLPVSTVVGSAYFVEPSLGEQFLYYSATGIGLAIVAVMSLIVLRYRRIELTAPIIMVNMVEIFLTTSIIGLIGTIDLAAVAGIIAIIGTGVADQIIVVDELLKKGKNEEESVAGSARSTKEKLGKAFFIIFTVAGVLIVSMLPLLLSGIVEMMGFALSTIIGVIIGVLLTRPAFGVIIEDIASRTRTN